MRDRCATPPRDDPSRWLRGCGCQTSSASPAIWPPGLATLAMVDPGLRVDLAALADDLDAEALRNSAGRELFTNPAKSLAERMSGCEVVHRG